MTNIFRLIVVCCLAISLNAARDFNGTTDLLSCGTVGDSVMTENGALTISAWMKADTTGEGGFGRIVDRGAAASASGPAFLTTGTAALRFSTENGATDMVRQTSASVWTAGTWTHVLLTWDGGTTASNVHIYVNGTETSYATTTNGGAAATNNATDALVIGNNPGATRTFDGKLAEVGIWAAVLGASEIKALAAGVSPPKVHAGAVAFRYWPIVGASTEPDWSGGGSNCTVTDDTGVQDHSPTAAPFGTR